MSQNLKTCPFCGKINTLFINCDDGYYSVICDFRKDGCGAESGMRKTEKEAIDLWNTRDTGWIPVSDRLPDLNNVSVLFDWQTKSVSVLCQDKHSKIVSAEYMEEKPEYMEDCVWSDRGFYSIETDSFIPNVIAWQPLPEPYQP